MRISLGCIAVALLLSDQVSAHEGAPANLARMDLFTDGPTLLYERAESYRNLSRVDDAIVMLELVEALHPDEARVWLERGRLERDRGRHAAAIAAFDEYLGRGGTEVYGARLLRGRSHLARGATAAALADYRAAIAAAPGVDAYFEAGRLLTELGREAQAEALLAEGVEATRAAVLVEALVRVEGDPSRLDPWIAAARVKTRWLLLRAEVQPADLAAVDRRAAVAEAERLVRRRTTTLALTDRAAAYLAVGRRTDAIADLRRALSRSPAYKRARRMLERVEGRAR